MTELDERIRATMLMLVEASPPPPRFEEIAAATPTVHRRRMLLAVVIVLVPAVAISVVVLQGGGSGPNATTNPPFVSARPPIGKSEALGKGPVFVPPTGEAGGRTRLPITFLDGTHLVLSYPSRLHLAALGFTPGAAISWPVSAPDPLKPQECCSRSLVIIHGTIGDVFRNRRPAKYYPGPHGTSVPFYEGSDVSYLAEQIGSWVLLVYDYPRHSPFSNARMTDGERAVMARNLSGHQTSAGFLVLTPTSPLTLARTDVPDGQFGADVLGLIFRGCRSSANAPTVGHGFQVETVDPSSGTWLCLRSIPLVVSVGGTSTFQEQVRDQLEITARN